MLLSSPTDIKLDRKKLARDKHSSLLCLVVVGDEKKVL